MFALAVVFVLPVAPAAGTETAPSDAASAEAAKLGDGVRQAIREDGKAHVIITLDVADAAARSLDRLRSDVAASRATFLSSIQAGAGFEIRRQFDAVPALAVTIRSEAVLERILAHPAVVGVHDDMGGTGTLANSVPFIGADLRHAGGNDGSGVTVAVLDTGADLDHPDLVDDILANQACFGDNDGAIDGAGFCPNGSDRQTGAGAAEDDAGHGTHVTGIVTSAGTVSSPGAAPGAEIVPVKVTDNCNFSGCFYFFSEIVAAWNWIINNNDTLGIDVINMSFGTGAQFPGSCDASFPAAATAITTLRSMGITPFASAGNNSGTQMGAPACLSGVIAVGATDNADNVAGFSDSNATTDIFAPGVNVVSLAIGGGTTTASGTSMASPHAAGCAALLIQTGEATTPAAIETRLETSPFQVTDAAGLTFPRIDCLPDDEPPEADIGGPYVTDEGVDAALDASGSSDPEGDPLTYEWDLDNDGSFDDAAGATAVFADVGQDGVFPVSVRVTDPIGQQAVDSTTVTVVNVAPSVSASSDSPVDENTPVTVTGAVSDPGWLETLTATIDWGDGSGPQALTGTLENARPDATLSFEASHVYGDNGTFTVEICGFDDDTQTCGALELSVLNVAPTADIDDSAALPFAGGSALVASVGEPVMFEAGSTDPGSDDLTLSWDWDDGPPNPDVTTVYPNDPADFPDPLPSPEINPRAVTDEQTHAFGDACLYDVAFVADDDDGGTASDSIAVIILGDADRVRSAGYWFRQFEQGVAQRIDDATLECYLDIVNYASGVFSEARSVTTIDEAEAVLDGRLAAATAAHKLDRQLLAAWLNYANGAVALDDLIDTDGDRVPDTPFADVIAAAEASRLDPGATDSDLLAHKDLLERINVHA